jgi:hypothetical protein
MIVGGMVRCWAGQREGLTETQTFHKFGQILDTRHKSVQFVAGFIQASSRQFGSVLQ